MSGDYYGKQIAHQTGITPEDREAFELRWKAMIADIRPVPMPHFPQLTLKNVEPEIAPRLAKEKPWRPGPA